VPIAAALAADDYRVRQIAPGPHTRRLGAERYETDFGSGETLAELHRMLVGELGEPVGAIINLLPLTPRFLRGGLVDASLTKELTMWTFNFVKEFEHDLLSSAACDEPAGGGWFFNVTALDGRFGLSGQSSKTSSGSLCGAGTLGVAKTLSRECPSLRVQNIDVEPAMDQAVLVARLLDEIHFGQERLELGLTASGCWHLELKQESTPADLALSPIEKGSVVLVTGGAYGITADVTRSLAAAGPRLIVVGRSRVESEEKPETCALDEAGLRRYLIERARAAGGTPVPREIENGVQRLLKERQIRANLSAFAASGATVEYHAVDVSDEGPFSALIDDVYDRFGRIDVVLHGAGIIHDKRIRDKTPESFAAVFDTKVASALTLAHKLRPESLKALVFFSSISGRFGNAGQADYSAANEFLNKLAQFLDRRWPTTRVVAINWGPWDAGMVSGELARMYEARGIHRIPISEGVRFLESELHRGDSGPAEVVVSASIEQIAGLTRGRRG